MFRIAIQMIKDDKLKSLGTLIGVVFAVLLMTQQLSILLGILARVTSIIYRMDADIWVASAATESTESTGNIPEQRVQQAASVPGVLWATPMIDSGAMVTKPDGVKEAVRIVGLEPPLFAGIDPSAIHPSSSLQDLSKPSQIMLDWSDRKTFHMVEKGDRIEINGRYASVAGFTQGIMPFPAMVIHTNLRDARDFTHFPEGRITYVLVKVAPGNSVDEVKNRIQARITESVVVTGAELEAMNRRHFLRRTPVGYVFGLGTILAAVIGTVIVTVTQFSAVVDRTREYGTLKALGATRKDLSRLLRIQALIFAGVGYIQGNILFLLVRALMVAVGAPITLVTPWWVRLGVAVATIGVCQLASTLAIRRVLRLEPALVFRG